MYSRVYVEITNICNMSCSFCHGHSRPPRRMSEDEFSRVLDALDELEFINKQFFMKFFAVYAFFFVTGKEIIIFLFAIRNIGNGVA